MLPLNSRPETAGVSASGTPAKRRHNGALLRIPHVLVAALAALALTLPGCKAALDAKTESFRATKRDWWIFGKERTSLLLHQFVYDREADRSGAQTADPLMLSMKGISACWYPLERETKDIDPLIKAKRISELYDMAPTPLTEYAIPYTQLIQSIEKVPELRNINTSFKKAAARWILDFPVDFAIDYALCTAGLTAVAGAVGVALAAPTGMSSLALPALAGHWGSSVACALLTSSTGAYDGLKAPINSLYNPVKDAAAQAAGEAYNDVKGRRKAIAERLFPMNDQGQHAAIIESSVEDMAKIDWDEMQRLQRLVAELGSSRTTTYKDGTKKNLSTSQRCKAIPVLKAQGNFFSPDLEQLPQTMNSNLRERGYTQSEIDAFMAKTKPSPQPGAPAQPVVPVSSSGRSSPY